MSESDNVESQKYEIWKKKRNIKNNEISKKVKSPKKKIIIIKKIMKLQEKWNLKKKKKKNQKKFQNSKILELKKY